MSLIEWKDEFAIGIPDVDYEHQQLITLINDLHDDMKKEGGASRERVVACLGEIYTWIAAHFALEERIMRDMRYDQLAAHKADHDALLEDIRDIMDHHAEGGYFAYEGLLSEHLHDWFTVHFKTHDARLHHAVAH
jgi:hemerythrin